MSVDLIGYKLNGQLEDHGSTEHKYQSRQDILNLKITSVLLALVLILLKPGNLYLLTVKLLNPL